MAYYYKEDVEEAVQAADEALDYLLEAREHLNSAGNWGLVDMLGGGFLTSLVKHKKLNDVQGALDDARYALESLRDDLGELDLDTLDLHIDGFLSFTDLFIDNFFSDIMMQRKISNMKADLDDVIERVSDVRLLLLEKEEELDY